MAITFLQPYGYYVIAIWLLRFCSISANVVSDFSSLIKRVNFKQNKAVNAPFKFETIVMVMSSTHKGHKDNFRILSAIKEVKLEMRQLFPWKKI